MPDDAARITVALIHRHHPDHKEQVHWAIMPAVPRKGDTVHVPLAPLSDHNSIGLTVHHVAWTDDHSTGGNAKLPGWHVEIDLR